MSTNNINCLSKPVLNNEGINIHECPVCEDIFRTNQLLNNHMHRKHRPIVPSPDVDITMEERTEEVYSPEYFTRTSMNSESGFDNAETYDITPIDEDSFNFATLMSILLYDIVTDFKAPQKMHRRLVRLMNTLIKNIDKLGPDSQILYHDVLDRLLIKRTGLKCNKYDMCKNGCMLFGNAADDINVYHHRNIIKPASELKMMSIGEQIAVRLGNEEMRNELRYSANRPTNSGSFMTDIHDSAALQTYSHSLIEEPDVVVDVYVMLCTDGFVNQKKGKKSMTMMHVNILNLDPSIRSEDSSMIQLAVLPGPKKPVDLDSFLRPVMKEINRLSRSGMIVTSRGLVVCRGRVHLVIATGDIVGVSDLIHHSGHTSNYPCRICIGEAESPANDPYGKYLLKNDAPLRTIENFKEGDSAHGINGRTIFGELPNFNGSLFFGLDEMHLLGGGVAKLVLEFITVPLYSESKKTSKFFCRTAKNVFNVDGYTFRMNCDDLKDMGNMMAESRKTIPTSFQGCWDDIIIKKDVTRMVDYIDFLLYTVPTLVCPMIINVEARRALYALFLGCSIALKWSILGNSTLRNT